MGITPEHARGVIDSLGNAGSKASLGYWAILVMAAVMVGVVYLLHSSLMNYDKLVANELESKSQLIATLMQHAVEQAPEKMDVERQTKIVRTLGEAADELAKVKDEVRKNSIMLRELRSEYQPEKAGR